MLSPNAERHAFPGQPVLPRACFPSVAKTINGFLHGVFTHLPLFMFDVFIGVWGEVGGEKESRDGGAL